MLAIVTGNAHGIGLAISEDLRKLGYIVPVIDKPEYDLMADGIVKLFKDYPECDVLCNNVGGMGRSKKEDWKDCMQKNYGIAFELTIHYLPKMIEKRFGRVITISSIHGVDYMGLPWFSAAKAAQIALNCSLARRCNGFNVNFNTICPSNINVKPGETYNLNPNDISKIVIELINSDRNGEVIIIK